MEAGDDHDGWELRGRRGHARTRHVPLVPPLLDFNGARPGARPSGSGLDGLSSGSLSGLGLLLSSVDSGGSGGLRGLGGGVLLVLLGLLSTLGDGLGLGSGGGGSLLVLSGLAGAAEDAANLGRLDLGLTLSLLATFGGLSLLLLLAAKVSEERSAALLLESGGGGGLGGRSTLSGRSGLVRLLLLGLLFGLLLL